INGNYIDMRTDNTSNYGFTHCNGSTGGGQTYEVIGNTFANCGQYGIQYLTPNNNGARARIWNNFFQGPWRSANSVAMELGYLRNVDVWAMTIGMQSNLSATGTGVLMRPAGYAGDFRNNNIVLSGPTSEGLAMITESGNVNYSDYNNYYKANSGPGQFLVSINGSKL